MGDCHQSRSPWIGLDNLECWRYHLNARLPSYQRCGQQTQQLSYWRRNVVVRTGCPARAESPPENQFHHVDGFAWACAAQSGWHFELEHLTAAFFSWGLFSEKYRYPAARSGSVSVGIRYRVEPRRTANIMYLNLVNLHRSKPSLLAYDLTFNFCFRHRAHARTTRPGGAVS